jgi:endo-1,4-beta-xylanase
MHSKTLLASLLAPAAVSAVLNDLAVRAGLKYFGSALGEGPFQSDSTYASILRDTTEFGQVVPENGMKWDSTEGTQGVFTYGTADVSANQAKQGGQVLRCHTLIWHSQLPSWVRMNPPHPRPYRD